MVLLFQVERKNGLTEAPSALTAPPRTLSAWPRIFYSEQLLYAHTEPSNLSSLGDWILTKVDCCQIV